VTDLPRSAVAAPTPAPALGQSSFLILGGDDGSLVDFQPPEQHPGFPKTILAITPSPTPGSLSAECPSRM